MSDLPALSVSRYKLFSERKSKEVDSEVEADLKGSATREGRAFGYIARVPGSW